MAAVLLISKLRAELLFFFSTVKDTKRQTLSSNHLILYAMFLWDKDCKKTCYHHYDVSCTCKGFFFCPHVSQNTCPMPALSYTVSREVCGPLAGKMKSFFPCHTVSHIVNDGLLKPLLSVCTFKTTCIFRCKRLTVCPWKICYRDAKQRSEIQRGEKFPDVFCALTCNLIAGSHNLFRKW